jgi:hypothetical protein
VLPDAPSVRATAIISPLGSVTTIAQFMPIRAHSASPAAIASWAAWYDTWAGRWSASVAM